MASRCFIVNEWLFHDLAGENGQDAQRRAVMFLRSLVATCDHIAFTEGSAWARKAVQFVGHSGSSAVLRGVARYFTESILWNPDKCRRLTRDEIAPLAEEAVRGIPPDDVYLVEAYRSSAADLLVTGDQQLCDAARSVGVDAVMKEEFLDKYLGDLPTA